MASSIFDLPDKYLLFNTQQTKNVSIVVEIEGADLIANRAIFVRVRYGDPIQYGEPPYVYGGLRKLDGIRDILSLDGSSLTLSQRLEPEQGRASISQLSIALIDKDEYVTQLCTPNRIVKEILGRKVRVHLGYNDIAYPEDYFTVFKGKITDIQYSGGKYVLQLSDPNAQRRTQAFYTGKTKLVGNITNTDTTINVLDNTDFHKHILDATGFYDVAKPYNPDGTYNATAPKVTGCNTYLKIEDEYIEYGPLDSGTNQYTNVVRGARSSTAAPHDEGVEVQNCIQIRDNAMTLALKLMLSGWAGYYKEALPIQSIVKTLDSTLGDQPNSLTLPYDVDGIEDHGIYVGDYISIDGATNVTNDGMYSVTRIEDAFDQPNRVIYLLRVDNPSYNLIVEYPTAATISLRSQYDTLPIGCGAKLTPEEVDTQSHVDLANTFISGPENDLKFFFQDKEQSLKQFIEQEIYLVTSCYSLTKRGRLSVGYTLPPIAKLNLVILNTNNLVSAESIKISRALNARKFFNEIDYDYDYNDSGKYESAIRYLDADSLGTIGTFSPLPIKSRGARTEFGANTTFKKRAEFLLSRYRAAATIIECKCNWEAGTQIEAGDIVALQDEGNLQLANWGAGERNLGAQLYEVVDRSLDLRSGFVTLKLVSGFNYDITDRYSTISPSSMIASGDDEHLIIQDSFGAIFAFNERRKWRDYLGQPVQLHTEDYAEIYYTNIIGFDVVDNYKVLIDGIVDNVGAPATPSDFSILIMDIPKYPDTTSKTEMSLYKSVHGFFDPTFSVDSGASQTQFDVPVGEGVNYFVGAKLYVHSEDYSVLSDEVTVTEVVSDTIKVDKALGFVPNNTHLITGVGFKDTQGFYRLI